MQRRIECFISKSINTVDYAIFMDKLKENPNLVDSFLEHITINVTEFFRNPIVWDDLVNHIIPNILLFKNNNILNIWSAGCSSGEEAYTISILIKEHFPNVKTTITATDLDKKMISIAKKGIYNSSSMQNIPTHLKYKYFKKLEDTKVSKNNYLISDKARENIYFEEKDMLNSDFPENVDLIICRNVVIYFKENTKELLYDKFHKTLNTNGYLFVGNTEHILNYKDIGFSVEKNFFFRKT